MGCKGSQVQILSFRPLNINNLDEYLVFKKVSKFSPCTIPCTNKFLLTTSNYGSDVYEFAKGKLLTLMRGGHLVHMLCLKGACGGALKNYVSDAFFGRIFCVEF